MLAALAGGIYWHKEIRPGQEIERYLNSQTFGSGWEVERVFKRQGSWVAQVIVPVTPRNFTSDDLRREVRAFTEKRRYVILRECPRTTVEDFYGQAGVDHFTIEAREVGGQSSVEAVCDRSVDPGAALLESIK